MALAHPLSLFNECGGPRRNSDLHCPNTHGPWGECPLPFHKPIKASSRAVFSKGSLSWQPWHSPELGFGELSGFLAISPFSPQPFLGGLVFVNVNKAATDFESGCIFSLLKDFSDIFVSLLDCQADVCLSDARSESTNAVSLCLSLP